MMRRNADSICIFLYCACACVVGCDTGRNKPILPPQTTSSQASGTSDGVKTTAKLMLDHPEYANWSRFPVRSRITRKRVVSNDNGQVRVTTQMWLDSKSATEVAVGSQVTVERDGYPLEVNPESITKYPAQFALPEGMSPDYFLLPSQKAKLMGTERMTIGDREFETEVFEWSENNEAGPMSVKLWRSIEMPGRIVRQELVTESSSTRTVEVVDTLNLGSAPSDPTPEPASSSDTQALDSSAPSGPSSL
jgi:hypothetical protein